MSRWLWALAGGLLIGAVLESSYRADRRAWAQERQRTEARLEALERRVQTEHDQANRLARRIEAVESHTRGIGYFGASWQIGAGLAGRLTTADVKLYPTLAGTRVNVTFQYSGRCPGIVNMTIVRTGQPLFTVPATTEACVIDHEVPFNWWEVQEIKFGP